MQQSENKCGRWLSRATITSAILLHAGVAPAQTELVNKNGFSLNIGLEAGAYYAHTKGANFGAGKTDVRSGAVSSDSVDSIEAYLKPSLDAAYETGLAGTFYGAVAYVGAATRGDGDPGGFTSSGDDSINSEQLYLGWRSGKVLSSFGEDVVDLSWGRQEFRIGDGFLIDDGNTDQFDKAAYWLGPRSSFERAGLFRLNTKPVRFDAFQLKSDGDQDSTELYGMNVELVDEIRGTLGATYMHVTRSDENAFVRDGMDVFSLRGQGNPIASIKELFLSAEYVREKGGVNIAKIDADAWYGEVGYTLQQVPWAPNITYRYSRFSGDDLGTADTENFDPLFYGGDRSWGTWTQGEVAGNYLLFNSNQRSHMIHLSATPNDALGVGLIYYAHQLDQKHYFGTAVTDRDFADEINIYVDWYPQDYLSLGAVYGVAFPKQGGRDAFGDDQSMQIIQVFATLNF